MRVKLFIFECSRNYHVKKNEQNMKNIDVDFSQDILFSKFVIFDSKKGNINLGLFLKHS